MNILLVAPSKPAVSLGIEDFFIYEPLCLEYIAAGVASDHDVQILDMRIEKNLQEVVQAFRPDIVGITAYTVHVNIVRDLFAQVKQWNPDILTVVGGHHATVAPGDFVSPSIDLIVMGEGVAAFREIVQRHEKGQPFEGIPGTVFADDGRLVTSDALPVIDLDACPFPERSLTAKYRKHYYSEWMKPLVSVRTSKGCPYRCKFCSLWKIAGGKYFKRTPERVVEELAGIEEEFIFFADDESLVDASRMKDLARRIREAGIKKKYFLYGRSDTIARNPELLEMWRDVGLEQVLIGLEFFRDEDLEYANKGSTIAENEKAVKLLHDLGVEVYASLILRPEFDRSDFAAYRQYTRSLGLHFASFAVLTPLPGTDFYEEVKDRMITDNYDYVDFVHTLLPTKLPLKEFYQEYFDLSRKAVALSKRIAYLRRYPWRDIPSLLLKAHRYQKRLKRLYRDYAVPGAADAGKLGS